MKVANGVKNDESDDPIAKSLKERIAQGGLTEVVKPKKTERVAKLTEEVKERVAKPIEEVKTRPQTAIPEI